MSLFSERFPIPTVATHSLIDGAAVKGTPDEVEGKKGIVREIDVTTLILPETARKIGEWLISKADEAEKLVQRARETRKPGKKS